MTRLTKKTGKRTKRAKLKAKQNRLDKAARQKKKSAAPVLSLVHEGSVSTSSFAIDGDLDIKFYIGDYLDRVPSTDPIFKYLIPDLSAWDEWKTEFLTEEQIHHVVDLAEKKSLSEFLYGWDDLSEPGYKHHYDAFCKL